MELGVQVSVTLWLAEEVSVAESEMVMDEFVALLMTVTEPETLPVTVGAKATLKEVD